jgi:hypothetical protein
MKRSIIKYYSCLLMLVLLAMGCKKDPDVHITEEQVGDSKVTFFVDFVMKGGEFEAVVKGKPYTDPGVTATEKGEPVDVKVAGSVNVNEVGIYRLTYSATNKDGFSKSINRYVGVLPEEPDPSVDLSGNYSSSTSPGATITKVADGFFHTTNCWGGGSVVVIPALFMCTDGKTLYLPIQSLGGERIVAEEPGVYANGKITWTLNRVDFDGGNGLELEKVWTKN